MSCEPTAELLPWLLNGTLGGAEERQVRSHLETCEACREELRQTRLAWSLAEGHLPAETLVDYALGSPLKSARRELVESHLAGCSQCRGELELMRSEPAEDERPIPRPSPPSRVQARSRPFPRFAVAATITAVIASSGWLWNVRQMTRERAVWHRQESELQARIAELSAPRLNTPVIELLPSSRETDLRSTALSVDTPAPEVAISEGSPWLALVLLSGSPDSREELTVEVLNSRQELLWQGHGLRRNSAGHFTLNLPVDLLPPGRLVIQIARRANKESVARYEALIKEH